ncbi:MotE family protein [Roseibium sp.]|uniref:MotE family protein n=1 Tax=Roseibium sp. TaxID=1936156 RepID=UPI003B5220C4
MPTLVDGCRTAGILTCLALQIVCAGSAARAETPPAKPVKVETVEIQHKDQHGQPLRDSELYCKNIADAASDARIQWQTWKMIALEGRLQARIAELQRKEREFEAWVARREELLEQVEDQVVTIIGRMRPTAAAEQLSTTEDEAAIGVLLKLKARVASAILDEMEPARAAQLTQSMMGFTNPVVQRRF